MSCCIQYSILMIISLRLKKSYRPTKQAGQVPVSETGRGSWWNFSRRSRIGIVDPFLLPTMYVCLDFYGAQFQNTAWLSRSMYVNVSRWYVSTICYRHRNVTCVLVWFNHLAEIGSSQQCLEDRYAQVTNLFGYLTSYFTFATEMGSESCPWRIVASPGQRINLTLINLNTVGVGNASVTSLDLSTRTGSRQHCAADAIATVRETLEDGATIEKMICHTVSRVASIYASQRDKLTVALSSAFRRDVNGSAKYILKYEGKLASLSWLSSLSLLIVLSDHLLHPSAPRQLPEGCT